MSSKEVGHQEVATSSLATLLIAPRTDLESLAELRFLLDGGDYDASGMCEQAREQCPVGSSLWRVLYATCQGDESESKGGRPQPLC